MRRAASLLVPLAVALLLPVVSSAQTEPPSVSLASSARTITGGDAVTLSGSIAPAASGQSVEIRDDEDDLVGSATTGAGGSYSLAVLPEGTRTYRAIWRDAFSDPVTVRVRAVVSVRMTAVRVFDDVTVRGEVQPARPGRRVDVSLTRGGRVVATRRVALGPAGGFSTIFRIGTPGAYRARASFTDLDVVRGAAVTGPDATPLPRLTSGSRGTFVELLERRLAELHYRLVATGDGVFDTRTADAVIAFHKVQRMERSSSVGAATWRALADPISPRPRHDWRGLHVEVDQTRQVLYTVEDGEVTNVLHVSTGTGGATRDGTFRVYRKLAGFSANRLYYPSYFDGLRALHGWTEVPTYAASHGCVRIPYWNATWVFGIADYGTRVVVYH